MEPPQLIAVLKAASVGALSIERPEDGEVHAAEQDVVTLGRRGEAQGLF